MSKIVNRLPFLVNDVNGSFIGVIDEAGREVALAAIALDAAGNVTGVSSPNGVQSLRQVSGMPRVAVCSDSTGEFYSYSTGNGATIVAPGIARITFGAAVAGGAYWPGDEIRVSAAPTRDCNTVSGIVTAVDPSRLWVEYTVSPSKDNGIVGSTPNLYRKYATASLSHVNHAFSQLKMRFTISVDAALGGGDSEQLGEVLARDWADSDISIYGPGMNDVYARGWSFARIQASDIANLKEMRRAARLIILSIPPRRSTAPGWSSGAFAVWRQVNEWRRTYAATIGADFVDLTAADLNGLTYSPVSSATADAYITTPLQTINGDGVHQVALGGAIFGAGEAEVLASIPPYEFLPASASLNAIQGYIAANALMDRTTGNTTTGTATFQNLAGVAGAEVADTYTLGTTGGSALTIVKAGMVPRTKAIHGDVYGQAQRIIVDNSAVGAVNVTVTLSCASVNASLVDGDSVEYGMALLFSDAATPGTGTPAAAYGLTVQFNDQHATAGNKFGAAMAGDSSTGRLPGYSLVPWKVDRTRRTAVAGAFSANCIVSVSFIVPAGIGLTACLDVGRVLIKRIPQ